MRMLIFSVLDVIITVCELNIEGVKDLSLPCFVKRSGEFLYHWFKWRSWTIHKKGYIL